MPVLGLLWQQLKNGHVVEIVDQRLMGNPISVNDCFPVVVQLIDPNGTIITSRHKLRLSRKSVLLHNMPGSLRAPGVL